jgi:predicted membrane protein
MSDSDHKILRRILIAIIILLSIVLLVLLLWLLYLWLSLVKLLKPTLLYVSGLIIIGVISCLFWILIIKAIKNRFQYSLRSLLIFVTIIAVFLGLLINPIKKAYQRAQNRQAAEDAMRVIGRLKTRVMLSYNNKSLHSEKSLEPEDIVYLNLDGSNCSDSDLALLSGLIDLKALSLTNTIVTDEGIMHLRKLTNLKGLYLGGTKVTEKGIKALQTALPNCKINMEQPEEMRAKALLKFKKLQEIIDNEDKQHPLSDEQIIKEMATRGQTVDLQYLKDMNVSHLRQSRDQMAGSTNKAAEPDAEKKE